MEKQEELMDLFGISTVFTFVVCLIAFGLSIYWKVSLQTWPKVGIPIAAFFLASLVPHLLFSRAKASYGIVKLLVLLGFLLQLLSICCAGPLFLFFFAAIF